MEPKHSGGDASSLAAQSFPLLGYDYGVQPDNTQTLLSVADGSSRTLQVPEMVGCYNRCMETPRGWVRIVEESYLDCCLWNPQTGEKVALPAMDKELPYDCRCLLSGAVSSPDCVVLVYDVKDPELLFCQVQGGGAWVSQSYDIGVYDPGCRCPPRKITIGAMAAVQGKFYFAESPDAIGVLSLARDPEPRLELTTFAAPLPVIENDVCNLWYLLESSQELFLVCLFYVGCSSLDLVEKVRVYRMGFTEQEWSRVSDIGDRAFLLGADGFAASCSATENGLKSGCVYFANDFVEYGNEYHVFDLMEGTCELHGPTQDLPFLWRRPFWMLPVVP